MENAAPTNSRKLVHGCTTLKSPKISKMTALLQWKDKHPSLLEWRTSMSMLWRTSKMAPMASFQSLQILFWQLCFLTSPEPLESIKRSAMALWRRDQEGQPTMSSAVALQSTESAIVKTSKLRKELSFFDRSITIPNTTCISIAKVACLMSVTAQTIGSMWVQRGKKERSWNIAVCAKHQWQWVQRGGAKNVLALSFAASASNATCRW